MWVVSFLRYKTQCLLGGYKTQPILAWFIFCVCLLYKFCSICCFAVAVLVFINCMSKYINIIFSTSEHLFKVETNSEKLTFYVSFVPFALTGFFFLIQCLKSAIKRKLFCSTLELLFKISPNSECANYVPGHSRHTDSSKQYFFMKTILCVRSNSYNGLPLQFLLPRKSKWWWVALSLRLTWQQTTELLNALTKNKKTLLTQNLF